MWRNIKQTRALVKLFLDGDAKTFLSHKNIENKNQNHYSASTRLDFLNEYSSYIEMNQCVDQDGNTVLVCAPWLDFVD